MKVYDASWLKNVCLHSELSWQHCVQGESSRNMKNYCCQVNNCLMINILMRYGRFNVFCHRYYM